MTKPQITRIWVIGVIVMVAGLIIGGISMGLMFANAGSWVPAGSGNGYDFVPRTDSYFWSTVSFLIVGGVIAAAGGIAQLAAWIGALVNTYQLLDKTWFIVLLAGGLIGLAVGLTQFAVMIAYVIAGPDAKSAEQQRMRPPQMPPQMPPQEPIPPMQRPTTLASS